MSTDLLFIVILIYTLFSILITLGRNTSEHHRVIMVPEIVKDKHPASIDEIGTVKLATVVNKPSGGT